MVTSAVVETLTLLAEETFVHAFYARSRDEYNLSYKWLGLEMGHVSN